MIQNEVTDSFAHTFPDMMKNKLDDPQVQEKLTQEKKRAEDKIKQNVNLFVYINRVKKKN